MRISDGRHQLPRQHALDLARAAHQAPSIHNTQPWQLRALPDGLAVVEDGARALPQTDPHGRDRAISCGAATRNAQVALARLGHDPRTVLLPDGDDAPTVALVTAGTPCPPTPATEALYRALWERRTYRRIFLDAAPSGTGGRSCSQVLRDAGPTPGARWELVPRSARADLSELLWRAAQHQVHDEGVRTELLDWTRNPQSGSGIPMRSHGTAPYPVDSLLVHSAQAVATMPSWVPEDLARGDVAVLLTSGDQRADWVRAGLALESLLLAVTAAGLAASFLNQPVQQEEFRPRLAELLAEPGWHPQTVLRIGAPLSVVPPTSRRPLVDVLRDPES